MGAGLAALALFASVTAYADEDLVVEQWTPPQTRTILVAPVYRFDQQFTTHALLAEVPDVYLVLIVDQRRLQWLPVRAEDDTQRLRLQTAADELRHGRFLDDKEPLGEWLATRSRGLASVDFQVRAAQAPASSAPWRDRSVAHALLSIRQRAGILHAELEGYLPYPVSATFPLGETWSREAAEFRACAKDDNAFAYCETLRRFRQDNEYALPAIAGPLWIGRAYVRHGCAPSGARYLVMLFSRGTDERHRQPADAVQWYVTSPVDEAERAALDSWPASGGGSGARLSPRLAAELEAQRAKQPKTFVERHLFVPQFSIAGADGRVLHALAGAGDQVSLVVVKRGAARSACTGGCVSPEDVELVAVSPGHTLGVTASPINQ